MEIVPERFLERSDINYKGQQFEFIPFGAGRRICAGIHLGVMNVELALANLLYAFDWEPPAGKRFEDIDDETANGLTLQKKNALYIYVSIIM
ncbi:hypothetical protein AgCh_039620 [Apium graveolens]